VATVSPDIDPIAAWTELRAAKGRRVTIIDLYRLAADGRGVQPHELPREERLVLARSVMPLIWPGWATTEGSDRQDPIEIVEYDARWPTVFEEWRLVIADALGSVAERVEHVGSTSVPGLVAKPIVDIQVTVKDVDDEDAYVPALEGVGVQLRSRDSLHRYLRPFPGRPRRVHLHVCNRGSEWERDHLLFRDYLRSHPQDAARYARAKWDALRDWSDDSWGYTEAKTEAILTILDHAEVWAADRAWRP
jgi:GrpB-like predicted nucleotidyltransferase (UPF0157 family)